MMKEIKYRAYSKRTKKVYHVLAIFFYQKVVKLSKICGSGISFLEQIDDVVLMQYTGLEDKNDVEIYEGDIVRGENKAHEKELIVRKFGTTYYLYEVVAGVEVAKRPYCRIDSRATCNDFSSSETDLEVIGNIYSDKRGLFIQKKSKELV